MKRAIVAACALVMWLVMPIVPASAMPQTSGVGCAEITATESCFQIIGPNGTDKVDYFVGTIYNRTPEFEWVTVEVKGPLGQVWGPVSNGLVELGYWTWGIRIGEYLYPGNYCADVWVMSEGFIQVCHSVHPG